MRAIHVNRLFALCALCLVGLFATPACGDDDDGKTDTIDAGDTGQTEVSSDAEADGDGADDTTVADVDDDTGPTTPMAHAFSACDAVSSTDQVPEGHYTFFDGCVGYNPLAATILLCPEILILADPEPVWTFSGTMVIRGTTYARLASVEGVARAWAPQDCIDDLGEGTCTGFSDFLTSLAADSTITCAEDTTYGGCMCDVTAIANTFDAGSMTQSPGQTEVSFVNAQGEVMTQTYTVADDGSDNWSIKFANNGNLDLVSIAHFDGEPTLCRSYCTYFMAGCNDVQGVTGYVDNEDCLTQCEGFTSTGETTPVTSGNSVECRMHHVQLAVSPPDATSLTTHCPHAQAVPASACVDG